MTIVVIVTDLTKYEPCSAQNMDGMLITDIIQTVSQTAVWLVSGDLGMGVYLRE